MRRYLVVPLLVISFSLGTPPVARAGEPLTLGGILVSWLISQTVTSAFQNISGYTNPWDIVRGVPTPNIPEMRRQLNHLAANDKANAEEIRRLRDALTDRMTRDQVVTLINASLCRIDKTLAQHAERLLKVEMETKALKADNEQLLAAIRTLRSQLKSHNVRLDSHDTRMNGMDARIDVHEKYIQDHEKRIRDLEQKVAELGVLAFAHFRKGEYQKAAAKFNEAIESDPGDPGYHYGKALALSKISNQQDAAKAVKTGAAAEFLRPTGQWYRTVMQRIQGPDRIWLEEMRRSYLNATTKPRQ
jgi:tetratricopeptide (TPR) repeat protein